MPLVVAASGATALAGLPAATAVVAPSVDVQLGVTDHPLREPVTAGQPEGPVTRILGHFEPLPTNTTARATHNAIEDKVYRAGAETHVGATEPEGALATIHLREGDRLDIGVDGFHQSLIYKLAPGMSFDDAYKELDRLSGVAGNAGTVANGDQTQNSLQPGTSDDAFAFISKVSLASARSEGEANAGRATAYFSLAEPEPVILDRGRYVLVCNFIPHSLNQNMRARIQVTPRK